MEAVLLAAAAPMLLFAGRFPWWMVLAGVLLAAATAGVRRVHGGPLWSRTPADWPLAFWLVIMLPVAVWAAPPPLREQFAWPRSAVVVWNVTLFATLVAHAGSSRRGLGWCLGGVLLAAQGMALLAPLGMEYRNKLWGLGRVYDLLPQPLLGQFAGAEAGFSTNQVAGSLLFVLPVLLVLLVAGRGRRTLLWWGLLLCAGWMVAVMVLAQSRGGLIGLAAGIVAAALLVRAWGWRVLAVLTAATLVTLAVVPSELVETLSDAPGVTTFGGLATVQNFRTLVWAAGQQGLRDFFFTGMGFGTFRELARLLYPLGNIDPGYDIAHAHNFFLQTGVDFGAPGLVAVLLIYIVAIVCLVRLYHTRGAPGWAAAPWLTWRVLSIGFTAALVAQSVYSLFDSVSVGAKPSFLWWSLFALVFALEAQRREAQRSVDAAGAGRPATG